MLLALAQPQAPTESLAGAQLQAELLWCLRQNGQTWQAALQRLVSQDVAHLQRSLGLPADVSQPAPPQCCKWRHLPQPPVSGAGLLWLHAPFGVCLCPLVASQPVHDFGLEDRPDCRLKHSRHGVWEFVWCPLPEDCVQAPVRSRAGAGSLAAAGWLATPRVEQRAS